jgi:hypothetical protein
MRILVVDDDEYWRDHLKFLLTNLGIKVDVARNWRRGVEILRKGGIDRLILDLHLGYSSADGLFMLSLIKQEKLAIPTMILSYGVDFIGITGSCYCYSFVKEVIPKKRFAEFTFPFQRFLGGTQEKETVMSMHSRVFVIHGRNGPARDRVVRILHEARTVPVFLEREAATGRTIIELVEEFTDVKFCVGVMTACDIGYFKEEPDRAKKRARQNVVFEVGYVMGKLGRSRILLLREDIEMPSDLDGVRYLSLSSSDDQIKTALVRDFQTLGDIHYEL